MNELKVLRALGSLRVDENGKAPDPTKIKSRLLVIGFVLLAMLFQFNSDSELSIHWIIGLSICSGICFGGVIYLYFASKVWPYERQYIDFNKIDERINELES